MTGQLPSVKLTPEHLLTLYQVSGWINSTLNFDKALNNVMDAVMQVTRAERGFLVIHDDETQDLKVLIARGIDGETIEAEGYSTTIVNEVVNKRESLLTNNAQFDNRFNPSQSIIIRNLRAVLCAPMMVKDRLIGVVYVDTSMKSGNFREDDRALLTAVSGIAARAIENARLYQVAIEKGRLERELQMAREIQRGLLPQHLPRLAGYDIAAHWESAREVAGDFYDAFMLGDNSMGTVIADVSDKGAPAALFMAVARTLIRSHAHAGLSAVDTVKLTNDLLLSDAEQNGMFVTLYYSRFNANGESVHVCGGHNPPIIYRAQGRQTDLMPRGGRALGWFADNPVEAVALKLNVGDIMVFYTDGLTEAENPQAEPFGEDRLAQSIRTNAQLNASALRDAILRDVDTFCAGNPPFDDITMLVVKYAS